MNEDSRRSMTLNKKFLGRQPKVLEYYTSSLMINDMPMLHG